MATKKRLIDPEPLAMCVALYVAENAYLNDTALDVLKKVSDWVNDAPTVDAVEVVRCRDCEHWKELWLEGVTSGKCMVGKTMTTEPDHFCSYGERKNNAER